MRRQLTAIEIVFRSEAKTVPNLLVASSAPVNRNRNEDLYADYSQGYYADGAYTALPMPNARIVCKGTEEEEDLDAQDAYYTSLCARFAELSDRLQNPPPLKDVNSIELPPQYWPKRTWRNKLLNTTPTMVRLGRIPQDMVIQGLEVLESVLSSGNLRDSKGKKVGAWAWALLARCRDVGQMGSEEVGVLRNVGKKAVWLLRRLAAGEVLGEESIDGDEDEAEEDVDAEDGEGSEGGEGHDDSGGGLEMATPEAVFQQPGDEEALLAEARERMLSSLPASSQPHDDSETDNSLCVDNTEGQNDPNGVVEQDADQVVEAQQNCPEAVFGKMDMHATLDMLVTIIGECYGQRDLFDGRLLWDEIDGFS